MTIDDVDGKFRRNVLLLSTTVLLSALLELKVPASAHIVSGLIEDPHSSPARIWLAALLVLAYLICRYHFSQGRKDSSGTYVKEGISYRDRLLARIAATSEASRRTDLRRKAAEARGKPTKYRFTSDQATPTDIRWSSDGTIYYRTHWHDDEAGEFDQRYSPGEEHESSDSTVMGRMEFFSVRMKIFFRLLTFTHGTFEVAVPYIMAVAAMTVCIVRGIQAYLS